MENQSKSIEEKKIELKEENKIVEEKKEELNNNNINEENIEIMDIISELDSLSLNFEKINFLNRRFEFKSYFGTIKSFKEEDNEIKVEVEWDDKKNESFLNFYL